MPENCWQETRRDEVETVALAVCHRHRGGRNLRQVRRESTSEVWAATGCSRATSNHSADAMTESNGQERGSTPDHDRRGAVVGGIEQAIRIGWPLEDRYLENVG